MCAHAPPTPMSNHPALAGWLTVACIAAVHVGGAQLGCCPAFCKAGHNQAQCCLACVLTWLFLIRCYRAARQQRGAAPLEPHILSVLKRCVLKTLAFAFGLRLRSKTRCFETRVLGRRLPNGKPQKRLRFRALRSKTLAFKKRIAIISCDFKISLGARACV